MRWIFSTFDTSSKNNWNLFITFIDILKHCAAPNNCCETLNGIGVDNARNSFVYTQKSHIRYFTRATRGSNHKNTFYRLWYYLLSSKNSIWYYHPAPPPLSPVSWPMIVSYNSNEIIKRYKQHSPAWLQCDRWFELVNWDVSQVL